MPAPWRMKALVLGLPFNSFKGIGEAWSQTACTSVFNGDFHIETMLVKLANCRANIWSHAVVSLSSSTWEINVWERKQTACGVSLWSEFVCDYMASVDIFPHFSQHFYLHSACSGIHQDERSLNKFSRHNKLSIARRSVRAMTDWLDSAVKQSLHKQTAHLR